MRNSLKRAARCDHLGGVPRKLVIAAVGAFAKVVTNVLNSTEVHNAETLMRLVRSRPQGQPLITVSNHKSTLDDPLIWGFKGFPTGDAQLARRLKWGTASLIARAPVTPMVLPIVHSGFEKVMPEHSFFGRRPPVPLCNKDIEIIIGEPVQFDIQTLRQEAMAVSQEAPFHSLGWPNLSPGGLNEAQQRWLYTSISDRIWTAMERLRCLGLSLKKEKM